MMCSVHIRTFSIQVPLSLGVADKSHHIDDRHLQRVGIDSELFLQIPILIKHRNKDRNT